MPSHHPLGLGECCPLGGKALIAPSELAALAAAARTGQTSSFAGTDETDASFRREHSISIIFQIKNYIILKLEL